jgi:hypothetical protein
MVINIYHGGMRQEIRLGQGINMKGDNSVVSSQ